MTERQKKLVEDYGPRFYKRARDIQTDFLHLSADAVSVLTDSEWKEYSAAIDQVVTKLQKMQKIVVNRMTEAGLTVK